MEAMCGLCYLNALTIRGKFPIPIFDELVDELSSASWFSTLNLNSGFHQIRMKAREKFKTKLISVILSSK